MSENAGQIYLLQVAVLLSDNDNHAPYLADYNTSSTLVWRIDLFVGSSRYQNPMTLLRHGVLKKLENKYTQRIGESNEMQSIRLFTFPLFALCETFSKPHTWIVAYINICNAKPNYNWYNSMACTDVFYVSFRPGQSV